MAKSLIPLIDIADDACDFVGDSLRKHRRFMAKQAARAFKQVNMFISSPVSVHTSYFRIQNVIEMPDDFVYETKVALKYRGKIVYLGRNYELEIQDKYDPHEFNQSDTYDYFRNPDPDVTVPFYDHDGNIVLACGRGVKSGGLYRVDSKRGEIHIGSNIPTDATLMVEYVTDGISKGIKFVPSEMYNVIYYFTLFQYFLKKGDGRYREFERYWDEATFQIKSMYNDVPINYILSLFRETDYGTINNHL